MYGSIVVSDSVFVYVGDEWASIWGLRLGVNLSEAGGRW